MATGKHIIEASYVSIVTGDEGEFEDLKGFYESLRFRLVKNYSKVSNVRYMSGSGDPRMHLGISSDSSKEVWMESFPLQEVEKNGSMRPWQEHSVYHGDNTKKLSKSTLLKIRLSSLAEVSRRDQDIHFFTTNLQEIKHELAKLGVKYEEKKEGLVTADPAGNRLVFSGFETFISHHKFETPEEYLSFKSKQIENAEGHSQRSFSNDELPAADTIKKRKIAVMTSGGDAPGMNPAVRAVVRTGIYCGFDVFAVYEGYEGLVKGGDLLKKMEWNDVRSFLSLGGTAIGTARCAEFREREGRLQAAYNMVINGIDALIVCGGDGSLTGADLFRSEWPSLIKELVETNRLSSKEVEPFQHLTIVGLVGSIDNDMSSTDATIGAHSSLARITEMVDYIDATATSHSRAFVVEVMGRHCGWLGLKAGLSTGADYIFIPERPPSASKWRDELKKVCADHRAKGRRKTTVIVAEGAIDDELNPITSEQIKDVLVEMGLDTRITTLGHVQRGGTAVAYDRLLATLQGVDAVKAVIDSTPETPSPMIGILENKITRQPLVEAVKLTKSIATSIENKEFDKAMSLRDSSFEEAYNHFLSISVHDDGSEVLPENKRLNIGVVHVGASSSGLNAATRAATLYCISRGHRCLAIQNGFSGLINTGSIKELTWLDVEGWHNKGGSEIGTNRSLPSEDFGKVAYYIQKYNLNGLIIIGGFESFAALYELNENSKNYPIFNIPKIVIPSTVSNNVPGTEYSLGCDTCLNQLVDYCDAVKQSASSSRRRVFVVEVQGGYSGYVASFCGLVTGAIATYTPEKKIDLKTIQEDIRLLFDVFKNDRGEDKNGKMIIRNEQSSTVFTTELISDLIRENAHGRFETRTGIPGHVQQGYNPSCVDRVTAVKFAVKAVEFIEEWNDAKDGSVVIGIQGAKITYKDIKSLYESETDVKLRKGKTVHWKKLSDVSDMLSGRLLLRQKEKSTQI